MRIPRSSGPRLLRSFAVRSALGMVAVQAAVVPTLVATDADGDHVVRCLRREAIAEAHGVPQGVEVAA